MTHQSRSAMECQHNPSLEGLLLHFLRENEAVLYSLHDSQYSIKAWPNARNTSKQHLATLMHDVATCVERAGQSNATFSTQHVDVYVPQAPGTQQVDLARMP